MEIDTTISTDTINIPKECRNAMPFNTPVMIIDIEKKGKYKSRLGNGIKKISSPHIDTTNWKFNRDEANAR